MNFLNWILNLAGLFLWIDWRQAVLTKQPRPILSLASAVRPAERRIGAGWESLGGLILLLIVRPCFYYMIGSQLDWTPQFDLLAISLPWRSDLLVRMYVFSTLSFLLALGFYYAALLLLSAINRGLPDSDPMQRFVRLQLGFLERVPRWLKFFLPSLTAGLAWVLFTPLLGELELLPSVPSSEVIWGQALAFAVAAPLVWKWLLITLFILHLLNAYVYLGNHSIWPYISTTVRKILTPFSFLTFTKLDLAPVLGIGIVFLIADFVLGPAAIYLFQKFSS